MFSCSPFNWRAPSTAHGLPTVVWTWLRSPLLDDEPRPPTGLSANYPHGTHSGWAGPLFMTQHAVRLSAQLRERTSHRTEEEGIDDQRGYHRRDGSGYIEARLPDLLSE